PKRVGERLDEVRARIESAGGDPSKITIVAVTKGYGAEAAEAAYAAGCRDFGENYAAELEAKAASIPSDARWHFLGAVQRNKVKAIAGQVSTWHGLDRRAAGAEIAKRAPGAAVLVQVNLSGGEGRNGCRPEDTAAVVDELRALGLDVRGLMGVAGLDREARPQFRELAELAHDLALDELSMGMSGDLEAAVQEGATIVRVGTAVFGARPGAAQVRR
ncbi:MAG: dependent protein, partial [Actinomycetota bacterium]|nr:dependent protein [Actinomycetota bacterium]